MSRDMVRDGLVYTVEDGDRIYVDVKREDTGEYVGVLIYVIVPAHHDGSGGEVWYRQDWDTMTIVGSWHDRNDAVTGAVSHAVRQVAEQ